MKNKNHTAEDLINKRRFHICLKNQWLNNTTNVTNIKITKKLTMARSSGLNLILLKPYKINLFIIIVTYKKKLKLTLKFTH